MSAPRSPMDALLRPQSIALVGASDSRDSWAVRLYENLKLMNFPVRFYPINPNRCEIWGQTCYPNFAALPEPVDLALVVIPSAAIPATLEEAACHGLRCALIYAAQFGEGDDAEGAARARALLALRARFGLRICGPNCMGVLSLVVALGLADRAAVEAAAQAMRAGLLARQPDVRVDGFLVQEMVRGLEYIIGARTDPLYGPYLVLGLGGVTVEVLDDTAVALLPVSESEVRAMLASLRSAPLLGVFRGRPPCDVDALVRAVLGLSELFLDHRDFVNDIEINPLMIGRQGEGVRAIDVRIVRASPLPEGEVDGERQRDSG